MENDPQHIAQPIEEALFRIMRPDLLQIYQQEKDRHRDELKAIETARKRAKNMIRRLFGKLREQKEAELEQEYLERVQGESDRHDQFMRELRETTRDHWEAK